MGSIIYSLKENLLKEFFIYKDNKIYNMAEKNISFSVFCSEAKMVDGGKDGYLFSELFVTLL